MNSRTRATCYLFLVCVCLVQFVVLPARQRTHQIDRHARQLKQEIGQLQHENAKLSREIEALKSDPYYVEYQLRTRLRYRGPDEYRPGDDNGDGGG